MGKPDIAHIGYHRTGTNFLQECLFPAMGCALFQPSQSGWRFFADETAFDQSAAQAFYAAEQRKNLDDRPFLISHESLTGTAERDDLSVPKKLHKLNGEMKVIVVLRSQYDMLRSLYHLHVKGGGTLSYAAFVTRAIEGGKSRYDVMIARLRELFGRDAVLVLLFEDLKRSPEDFATAICAFVGVDPLTAPPNRRVNASASDSALQLRRVVNDWLDIGQSPKAWKASLRDLGSAVAQKADALSLGLKGSPIAPVDTEAVQSAIHAAYVDGNRRLADMIGRPLNDYGYPV